MSADFAALAHSIRAVPGVRVCLVVSQEGLVLGVAPESEEGKATRAWSRLAAIGDVEKGFLAMGDEMWAFSRRGPFAALAIGDPAARPGLILTELEQALLAANESRVRDREVLRSRPVLSQPSQDVVQSRFRAPLHRSDVPGQPDTGGERPAARASDQVLPQSEPQDARPEPRDARPEPQDARPEPRDARPDDDWVVDSIEISREFGALYGDSGPEAARPPEE